jgi:predicted DNA-binding transcriptional regulator AlpA
MPTTPPTAPTDPPQGKLLLTAREAAAVLSISERSLWAMTAPRGLLRPVRLGQSGRSVRYSLSELQRWIDSQQGGSQP